ncbi:MAG: hypothetical protein HYS38_06425 [Acidobacteria bacterium]|nr:hypothetical protein [Acidobacteriota bacterium]
MEKFNATPQLRSKKQIPRGACPEQKELILRFAQDDSEGLGMTTAIPKAIFIPMLAQSPRSEV